MEYKPSPEEGAATGTETILVLYDLINAVTVTTRVTSLIITMLRL
jgi:hypothetical protein